MRTSTVVTDFPFILSGLKNKKKKKKPCCKGALERITLDFSKPGEEKFCGNQNPWNAKGEREERPGRPVVARDQNTAFDYYYHEGSFESSFSARYSKWDDNQVWSSQEWKTDTSMCARSGNPLSLLGKDENPNQVSFTRRPSTMEQRNL